MDQMPFRPAARPSFAENEQNTLPEDLAMMLRRRMVTPMMQRQGIVPKGREAPQKTVSLNPDAEMALAMIGGRNA